MNWQAIGAVGETVRAITVFISLTYLAIRGGQNTPQIVNSLDVTRL